MVTQQYKYFDIIFALIFFWQTTQWIDFMINLFFLNVYFLIANFRYDILKNMTFISTYRAGAGCAMCASALDF